MSIKFVIVNNFHNIYAGRDRTNRQGRLLPGDGIIAYSLSCGRNKGEGGPADGNCKVDVDRMPVSVDRQADIRCRFYVLVGRSASFVRIHSVATASCYSDRIEPVFELLATIGRFGPAFLYGEKEVFDRIETAGSTACQASDDPVVAIKKRQRCAIQKGGDGAEPPAVHPVAQRATFQCEFSLKSVTCIL